MGMSLILLLIATVNGLSFHGSTGSLLPDIVSISSIAVSSSMSFSRHYTSFHKHHARNRFSFSAPSPSYQGGPTISPYQSPSPSSMTRGSPASAPSPATLPSQFMPTIAPIISTTGRTPPPPVLALPPLPPNKDCVSVTCTEPLTYTPPGSPCGCVWPIQVKLRLGVALYTFFPLVSELASEISAAMLLNHSQVRIIGADAASEQLEKTTVLINLVPLQLTFNETTAFSTYEKFWHKRVPIKTSLFGAYDVLYVHYPGLPPSPPSSPSSISTIDDPTYPGNSNNGRIIKPIGVDVSKRIKKHRLSTSMIAIMVLSSFTVLVLCVGFTWLFLLKSGVCVSKSKQIPDALISSAEKQSGVAGTMTFGRMHESESMSFSTSALTYAGSAKTFALNDIERATNNFDASRIVGEGGFGLVYHGNLDDGKEVAVKVLKRHDQHGGREFLAEVEMLGRLHHRNLVKLIGICTEGHSRCLVYEFVPNGSVESHLHGIDKETAPLDWDARIKIALGAARGLTYLHEDSSPRVIHRDFKSSNILLEQDFTPKVSDFGLARAALDEGNKHISTHVMGTFGYLAPEYAMTGHLLVKSDVYSYGVVLLELLTGRKPVDLSQPPGEENLVSWARQHLTNKESLETIIDQTIKFDVSFDSVAKVAAIASMCVQPEVSHRPFMGEVVQALKLVCNEFDEITRASNEPVEVSLTNQPISVCHSDDSKRALSVSELLSNTIAVEGQEFESFRRHSSSGPLRTGRGKKFWQRLRSLSRGSSSEHGYSSKLWP